MTEYVSSEYKNKEVISKFEYLKSQYEKESMEKIKTFTDIEINEQKIKSNIISFNHMIHGKVEELRYINNKIIQLTNYKQEIIDILMEMNKSQERYIKLFDKNILMGADLQMESPNHKDMLHLLSRDLRGEPTVNNIMDFERLKSYLFITKDSYAKRMFEVCGKIDDCIMDETRKLSAVNEFIGVYKRTLSSFDSDKKIFNKYKCTVCYENEVNVCLVPCGHTFCKGCSEKATKKCFMCNGEITSRNNIYLLGKEEEDTEFSPIDRNNPTLFGTNYVPN